METTTYSHAFFVGALDENFKASRLEESSLWTKEIIKADGNGRYNEDRGYNGLCTLYYKSFIDSMIEAEPEVQQRPRFLNDVHHYYYDVPEQQRHITFRTFNYTLQLSRLHIFTFPFHISLFVIEVDDSGQELNALTLGHSTLSRWDWNWDKHFTDEVKLQLTEALQPLKEFLPNADLAGLISNGNKLKLFQAIQLDVAEPDDKMLYEIGTSQKIGCIDNTKDRYCPASDYWKRIIHDNSVATFRNWKGLALMDSFTLLGTIDSFVRDDCNYLYFQLIYLRCLFEKTFCFTRNIAYRQSDKPVGKELPNEMVLMERYYLYSDISFNFQPDLLYKAMAKGMEIEEEKQQLTTQIKERAQREEAKEKDEEEERLNKIAFWLAAFAIFSVVCDLSSIIQSCDWSWISDSPWAPRALLIIGIVAIFAIALYFNRNKRNRR